MIDVAERESIAAKLGIEKCGHCGRFCPYCPRLLAVRPDLAPVPPVPIDRDPSFLSKGINFASAFAHHAASGFPQADEATADARLDSCRSCTAYFDPVNVSCRHRECGCDLRWKVTWADQKCPIGRW